MTLRKMRLLTALVLVATITAACEEQRHTSPQKSQSGLLTLDTVPLVDIGPTSPTDSVGMIGYATGATRLSNGVIAVADDYMPGVRFYKPSGEDLRATGGLGSGPSEFQGLLNWLGQCGADSVFVWDMMAGLMSVLDTAGRVVRRFPVSGDPGYFACSRSGLLAVLAVPKVFPEAAASAPHVRGEMTLRDTEGRVKLSLGEIPYAEYRPLGKLTRFAVAREFLYVGTADSAFIDVYTVGGARVEAVPVGTPTRRPTDKHYARAIDALVAPFTDRDQRASEKSRLLQIRKPEAMPPYTAVLADPNDYLWVVTSAPGDGETRFRVISRGGTAIDLRLPLELNVFDIGEDYVLGAYETLAGEQRVVMYRVSRL